MYVFQVVLRVCLNVEMVVVLKAGWNVMEFLSVKMALMKSTAVSSSLFCINGVIIA